ncbi:AAA family ATPase [Methanogenium sp. S4BF]|uniref:AAA family ATPase n=1 Tax=Methanogenium sp. S4BF TaxID=1789226 RepID=UPI0024164158|nr:AAA family ATPase [Methanogenium sp. S4BF]WFN34327.1 AAA family ATPase [Methanogenium sp. S4BF]
MSLKTLLVTPAGREKVWDVPGRNPPDAVRAADAFTGRFARRCAQYARIHYPKDWVILSPNFGYLLPDDEVRNYRNDEFGEYSLEFDTIRENADYDGLLGYDSVIFLGNREDYGGYIDIVRQTFTGSWVEVPLEHAASGGEMLGHLVDSLTRGTPLRSNIIHLSRIRVEGLFGELTHDISLFPEDSLSIITAPNGYGKTTILRILRAVFVGNVDELRILPFGSAELEFIRDDYTVSDVRDTLLIEKQQSSQFPLRIDISFTYTRGADGKKRQYVLRDGEYDSDVVSTELAGIIPPVPVKYISAQRLWHDRNRRKGVTGDLLACYDRNHEGAYELTILAYADDVIRRIQALLADYASIAQELDATYPARYLQALGDGGLAPSAAEIESDLIQLQIERESFETLGFLPYTRLDEGDVMITPGKIGDDPGVRTAIYLYIADSREKYQIFGGLKQKIDLLEEIINALFLNIDLTVDIESGFLLKFMGRDPVPPEALSSGEQNQLVMYYDLIFKTDPGTLVLIDEPEISLHVVWQRQFLDTILGIIAITGSDFILATHSPQLIHTHWDKTIDLSGNYPDER